MKQLYITPNVNIVKINEQDIITASYNGNEIDAGGTTGIIELPEVEMDIPGWMNDD